MTQHNSKKNYSIIYAWLVSYIAILFVPILLGIVFYNISKSSIEDEVYRSNKFLLQHIQQNADFLFSEIQRFSADITFNSRVEYLLSAKKPLTKKELGVVNELHEDFKLYKKSNRPIDYYYLYLNNIDLVFNGNSTTDSKTFYDILNISEYQNIWDWRKQILEVKKSEYLTNIRVDDTGKKIDMVSYIQPLPTNAGVEKNAVLVTMVDKDRFFGIAKSQIGAQGAAYILDSNNKVFTSLAVSDKYDSIKFDGLLKDDEGTIQTVVGKENVVVSYITSSVSGWKYVLAIPHSIFWTKVQKIINISIFGILGTIAISIALIRFFVKKNYTPINEMVKTLGDFVGLHLDKKNNELNFIEQVVEKAVNDKQKINSYLEKQNKILKSNFLSKLLKGKIDNGESIKEHLQSFDMEFESDNFVIMLIYVDDITNLFVEDKDLDDVEKFKLAQFIISNIMGELVEENYINYLTEVDDMMAFIVNVTEPIEEAKTQLNNICQQAQEFITKHFNISYSIAISNCHKTETGISEAYYETLSAMEYKMILADKKIIQFEDVKNQSSNTYYYPIEIERQLINNIRLGNFDASKSILEHVFDANFNERMLSIQLAKCLIFDLVSTMIKAINEIDHETNLDFFEELSPVETILSCETVDDMMSKMIFLLNKICSYIQANNVSSLKTKAEKYVFDNYDDINLSVSSIAEYLNVHPVYLSAAFKEQSGEGLLEFIGKLRVEKAKELLKTTATSNMETIGLKVGYANVRTFTRVFRKFEGVTPVKFKEINN